MESLLTQTGPRFTLSSESAGICRSGRRGQVIDLTDVTVTYPTGGRPRSV